MTKISGLVNAYDRDIPLDTDRLIITADDSPTPGLERSEYIDGLNIKKRWGFTARVFIPTAEVLALHDTPKDLVPAQGAGFAIVPMELIIQLSFNTTAYDTNTILEVITFAAADLLYSEDVLGTPSSVFYPAPRIEAAKPSIIDNQRLILTVNNADPLNGDSDLIVYLRGLILEV